MLIEFFPYSLYSTVRTNGPDAAPVFCTYLPANNPHAINVAHQRTAPDEATTTETRDDDEFRYNIPTDSDIIYASYANEMMTFSNRSKSREKNSCDAGTISCYDSNQCIPASKWCDSSIDCTDGSDETACSCKARLSRDKICDGYIDCPMGSDEIGCFGCDKFSYSCFSNALEFAAAKHSSFRQCYTITDKCDGMEACLNGKDEEDCTMIVRTVGQHLVKQIEYGESGVFRF